VDICVEQQWGSIKQAFQVTAEEVLGRKKGSEKVAWLSSEIRHIVEQRRDAKQKRKEEEVAAKHHNYLCRLVRKRNDREAYIGTLCEQKKNCRKQNVSRVVYEGVRKLTGRFASRITVVKDERG